MVSNFNSRIGRLNLCIPDSGDADSLATFEHDEIEWLLSRLADWPEAAMFANRSTPLTPVERHRLKEECRAIRESLLSRRETLTIDAVYDELPVEILWGLLRECEADEQAERGAIVAELESNPSLQNGSTE